jgi:hypothetical protein
MRAGLAFWAGIVGAAVMVLGLWIARALGATDFNFGYFWGSMLTGTTTTESWILGFVITLILGGLIALLYAAVFEALGRSSWGWGLLGGAVHLIIAGLVIGGIAAVHPAIPQAIADPGYYTANYGPNSVAVFSLLHLIYGIIVGGLYKPVHKAIATPQGRLMEEHPVGVGQERLGHEDVYVPPAPEDRTSAERRDVKIDRRR